MLRSLSIGNGDRIDNINEGCKLRKTTGDWAMVREIQFTSSSE